jgi:hypothetical protein
LCIVLLGWPASGSASTSITYLGVPTNDVPAPPAPVLGYYHKQGPFLRHGSKPELLFIGTFADGNSAMERWPVVKALGWFGSFSGAASVQQPTCILAGPVGGTVVHCGPPTTDGGFPLGPPSYDLTHARYHSRYLTFVENDMIDARLNVTTALPAPQQRLYTRYLRNLNHVPSLAHTSVAAAMVWNTALGGVEGPRQFPLVSIGGYMQTGVGVAIPGDLFNGQNQPFDIIQQSLAQHRLLVGPPIGTHHISTGTPPATLLPDVNAEANLIGALICHADEKQPKSVCGRAAIKKLLKHLK